MNDYDRRLEDMRDGPPTAAEAKAMQDEEERREAILEAEAATAWREAADRAEVAAGLWGGSTRVPGWLCFEARGRRREVLVAALRRRGRMPSSWDLWALDVRFEVGAAGASEGEARLRAVLRLDGPDKDREGLRESVEAGVLGAARIEDLGAGVELVEETGAR